MDNRKNVVFYLGILIFCGVVLYALFAHESRKTAPSTAPAATSAIEAAGTSEEAATAALTPLQGFSETQRLMLEDYNYLWQLIENDYIFLDAFEESTEKDSQAIKEKYYQRIARAHSYEDFYAYVIDPCIMEFEGLGHFYTLDFNQYRSLVRRYQIAATAPELEIYRPYLDMEVEAFTQPAALEFYHVEDEEQDGGQDSEVAADVASGTDNLEFAYYPESSTAYVKVKSMLLVEDSSDAAVLAGFFSDAEADGYKNCIIDIRGNGGGDSRYWADNIVTPNLKQALAATMYSVAKGETAYRWLSASPDVEPRPIADFPAPAPDYMKERDFFGADYFTVDTLECKKEGDDAYKPLFSGKFWLLIDEGVYSSADQLAYFCKQTGFACLVGTATGGTGIGIDPMGFSLPNSGICFRMAPAAALNADGTFQEISGTQPDYISADSDSALKMCMEIIQSTPL